MSPRRIVVVGPRVDGAIRSSHGGPDYRAIADDELGPHGEIRHLDWEPGTPIDEGTPGLDAELAEADALVLMPWMPWPGPFDRVVMDAERLAAAPRLEVIAGTFDFRFGWIDLDPVRRRSLTVVDTSRSMTPTVAEFAVAITLALVRDIPAAIDVVRSGGWYETHRGEEDFVFRDLADCRIGLAGYGSINRHYRRFVRPFGCEVRVFDPGLDEGTAAADGAGRAASLVELAGTSDVLVVAIPPTPTTIGVIDAAVIDALATGSLFVLVSRMAVVEQEALWRRVRAGEIRAAIDVFDPEPPPADAWFRTDPNVLPTPHIAGNVRWAHQRCFRDACIDAVRVLAGETPHYAATVGDAAFYGGAATTPADRPSR